MKKLTYKPLVDSTWIEKTYLCGSESVTAFLKRYSVYAEAQKVRDVHWDRVYKASGAIFIGHTAPVRAYTPDEIIEEAATGKTIPEKEWYVELIFLPNIMFPSLLFFLDHLNYGKGDGSSVQKIRDRRQDAKSLLMWIRDIMPIGITAMSSGHVQGRFLKNVSETCFEKITDKTLEYNRKYFSVELPTNQWLKTWRRNNSFSLGPC